MDKATQQDDAAQTYQRALMADAAFSATLQRVYGTRAGDRRYRSRDWPQEVTDAYELFRSANEAWLTLYRLTTARCNAEDTDPRA